MKPHASHVFEPSAHVEPVMASGQARSLVVFSREALRSIDRSAMAEFGIPGVVLMENAARGLAEQALAMLGSGGEVRGPVVVVCGRGNNGGDGYGAARHIHNAGRQVVLIVLSEPVAGSDAAINRAIARRMAIAEFDANTYERSAVVHSASLVVDAVFGTGLTRPLEEECVESRAIAWMNSRGCAVLAADVPSGMDCDTGRALGPVVQATRTATFAGLKPGFFTLDAQKLLGDVAVIDIGVPAELLTRHGRVLEAREHREAPEHEPFAAASGGTSKR